MLLTAAIISQTDCDTQNDSEADLQVTNNEIVDTSHKEKQNTLLQKTNDLHRDDKDVVEEPEILAVLHANGTRCRISEYQCDNKRCIPLNRFCDGTNDCGDSSDEARHCSRKY